MKYLFLLFIITILSVVSLFAQVVPNGGFENWTNGNPDNWYADNIPAFVAPVTQSSIAHSGSSSVKGTVTSYSGVVLEPIIQAGTTGNGFPITQRFKTVTGYYQFSPVQGDILGLNFILYKNGSAIATAVAIISVSASSWTQFNIDFTYITNEIPDNCILQFLIDGPNRGDYHVGSYFLLDDINLSDVLPVELISFSASVVKEIVNLSWKTATEVNNLGFNVERSANKIDWEKVAFVQGNQNSTSTISYSYIDKSVCQAGNYYYRLKQIDYDGSYKYSSIVKVDFNLPSIFTLEQNYPNPFNPSTKIQYNLPENSFVSLKVYNTIGQEVASLVNGVVPAGSHEINFDASKLNSGVYFYTIKSGNNFVQTRKMILMK
jgi:hypothetical protein